MIRRIDTAAADFDDQIELLVSYTEDEARDVRDTVASIIKDVRQRGDEALVALTNQFDHQSVSEMSDLTIDKAQLKAAYEAVDELIIDALKQSVSRVREYHERQLAATGNGEAWHYDDALGNSLGQTVNAMARVGIYAPGGKAAYPSTIIMTAVPARVAGVAEIVLCVPTPGGEINKVLLAAAYLCDVDHVFAIGGAQAVAAMAYGTDSVPKVDKIVGPGNIFVATAKELVFGDVGIDMIAGPSEIVIVADDSAQPDCVILDMFAQAEHDEMAQAIVVSTSDKLLQAITELLPGMLRQQTRRDIIGKALTDRGALIKAQSIDDVFAVVNRIAPEHLQLAMKEAESHVGKVRHAGAIFVGVDTTEVVGDYTAGPSHVLPTNGTARFASPLGVYDFQTRTSVIRCSREGAVALNRAAAIIAREEGLEAHAEAAIARVKG